MISVLTKFRNFYGRLKKKEQLDLWRVMTALRHSDIDTTDIYLFKNYSTGRIRFGLLGLRLSKKLNKDFPSIINTIPLNKYQTKIRNDSLIIQPVHFKDHFNGALKTLIKLKALPKNEK